MDIDISDISKNSKLVIEIFDKFNVIRDDLLIGGTKQRAWKSLSSGIEKELVYAGPWNGYGQLALTLAAKLSNKKAVLFMTRDTSPINIKSKCFGAEFKIYPDKALRELQKLAEDYTKENPNERKLMPFGMDNAEFRQELEIKIKDATEGILDFKNNYNFWLVAGSATLLNVLYKVFPNSKFNVVQVGKPILPKQLDETRTTLYIAPEDFYNDAELVPPYPSLINYDAKLWRFVNQYGQSGDYIWNVA